VAADGADSASRAGHQDRAGMRRLRSHCNYLWMGSVCGTIARVIGPRRALPIGQEAKAIRLEPGRATGGRRGVETPRDLANLSPLWKWSSFRCSRAGES